MGTFENEVSTDCVLFCLAIEWANPLGIWLWLEISHFYVSDLPPQLLFLVCIYRILKIRYGVRLLSLIRVKDKSQIWKRTECAEITI